MLENAAVYLRSLKSSSSIEGKTSKIVALPSISSRETLSERNNMASQTLAQPSRGDDEQQPNTRNLLRAESVLVKLSERQRLSRYSGVDFSPSKSISKFFFLFRFVWRMKIWFSFRAEEKLSLLIGLELRIASGRLESWKSLTPTRFCARTSLDSERASRRKEEGKVVLLEKQEERKKVVKKAFRNWQMKRKIWKRGKHFHFHPALGEELLSCKRNH